MDTDTLLEKMQQDAPENIVIHLRDSRYLVPVKIMKLLAWGIVPDFLKDENSKEAKDHPIVRTGLKRLIAPYLPMILKKTQGEEIEIKPRLNILQWLPTYAIHFAINLLASKEWSVNVENCESCGENVFRIVGISPHSYGILPLPEESTSQTSNREPLQGRGQPSPYGTADSDQSRGSMGSGGRTSVWQEHMGTRVTEATPNILSSDADVHPR
jgi:hypothetical protein